MTKNLAAHPEQRVAIFIDTQNLYHSAKSNHRANVNYEELIKVGVHGRRLVRAFAYVIKSIENTEEKFFDALEDLGIEMRMKDLQIFHTGAKKADWDVGIAVDMIRLTEKVDVIVLGSGDGDFIEVIRYCQSRGVRVEIMAFEKTTNSKVIEEADYFIDLGDRGAGFLIGPRRRTSRSPRPTRPPSPKPSSPRPRATASNLSLNAATPALSINDMEKTYSGSNISAANRAATENTTASVDPSIFGRGTGASRRVRPVVGLPGKTGASRVRKTLVNDETKRRKNMGNAFGNDVKS